MSAQFDSFFYFSSMYSDRLLTEFFNTAKDSAYEKYMEIQKGILDSTELHGIFNQDFTTSKELNETFNFPKGTVYHSLEGFAFPIYNNLLFTRKFGNGNVIISSNDILANPDIFGKRYTLTIGPYWFDHYYIIRDKFQRYWIAIKNDSAEGLTIDLINTLATEEWFFWSDRHSSVYQDLINTGIAFESTDDDMKMKVTMPKTQLTSHPDPTNENIWDICMTANYSITGKLLCYVGEAYLDTFTDTTMTFVIDKGFYQTIHASNTTVLITAIHKPQRRYIHVNCATEGTNPVIYLDDNGDPIPSANIKLYEFNNSKKVRGKRISLANVKPEYFPSIYNLTSITNADIFLEVVDYSDDITRTAFANHFAELIKALGSTEYRNSMMIGELSDYEAITDYDPISLNMTYDDFINSPYKDNLREYKLHKLLDLITSDPWLYVEYMKFMNRINKEGWIEAGTPKHYKLNTGMSSCFSDMTKPVVWDNSIVSNSSGNELIRFNSPHTYIKVRCENRWACIRVYINGQLITPTLIDEVDNNIYVFIPQELFAKHLSCYHEIQDLFDIGAITAKEAERRIAVAQPIIVEVLPKLDRTVTTRRYSKFIAGDLSNYYPIFENLIEESVTTHSLPLDTATKLVSDLNNYGQAYYVDTDGSMVHVVGYDALMNDDQSVTYTRKVANGLGDEKICLNDLLFCNLRTGDYIDVTKFDFLITLHRAEVEFNGGSRFVLESMEDDVQYLFTHAGELYMTKDLEGIILNQRTEDLSPIFNPDANPNSGEPRSWDDLKNRPIALKDLKIRVDDGQLLGSEIAVFIDRTMQQWEIKYEDSRVELGDDHKLRISLVDFFGKPDPNCIELYVNGVQVPQSDISVSGFTPIMPKKFNGTQILATSNGQIYLTQDLETIILESGEDTLTIELNERLTDYILNCPGNGLGEISHMYFQIYYLPRPFVSEVKTYTKTNHTSIRPTRSNLIADQFHDMKFCCPYTYNVYNLALGKICNHWYDAQGKLQSYLELSGDSHSLYLHPLSNYNNDRSKNFTRDVSRIVTLGFSEEDFDFNESEWKNYMTMNTDKNKIVYISTEPSRDVALEGLVDKWPLNEYLEK